MAGQRGRPRKVALPQPSASPGEVVNMDTSVAPEFRAPVTAPGIITPQSIRVTPERIAHVLEKLEKFAERGFSFSADDCSITITKGRCSECLNVTNTDAEFIRAINRVAVAAAAAGHRAVGQ
jgi:hypothetical protein